MGGIAGGNEKYSIQAKAPLRRSRRRHMSGVDGVKRSAKDCDVHENQVTG
jgi:hypothetical protein